MILNIKKDKIKLRDKLTKGGYMSNIIRTNGKGNLIIISGPSGAGKGTVIKKLMR